MGGREDGVKWGGREDGVKGVVVEDRVREGGGMLV